jgi:hypothetical protein
MQVNHRYYQDLTPEKVEELIEAARNQQLATGAVPGFAVRTAWSENVKAES